MNKLAVGAVASGLAVLLALAGRSAIGWSGRPSSQDPDVLRVSRADIGAVVKATGVVRPELGAEVRVGAQVSGVVKRLRVRTGDSVSKGQLLAEIEPRELQAKRDQAAAGLEAALANLRLARSDLVRKRNLAREDVIAKAELDAAERTADLAEAEEAEARANLAFGRVKLEQTRIVAPIEGVVASVTTQEGETVAAGLAAPTFVTIVDLKRLEVWAYVDETDIGRIRVGMEARFSVDAYPESEFPGQIAAIYPRPEIRDNVVDYVAVVRFAPPLEQTLRPEMTANVRIALDTRANVLAVPRGAVRREQGRSFVDCREGGAVVRRYVTVGRRDDSQVEIVDGLREGQEIVVSRGKSDGTRPE